MPKAVRDALGVRPGDELEFVVRGEEILVEPRPRRSVLDFAGIGAAGAGVVPATAEGLDTLVEQGMSKEAVARERRSQEPRGGRRPGSVP